MHSSPDTPVESRLPFALLKRVDQASDRFEEAWAAGAPPLLEAYLAEAPEPERTLLLRELLGLELMFRHRAGETPNPTEYLSRFPAHAAVIHDVFAQVPAGAARPDSAEVDRPAGARSADAGRKATLPQAMALETIPAAAGDWPVVPGYAILGVLGKGGMGVVYRARHLGLERVVALKMIRAGAQASADELARFRTEAALQARVHHPNLVQIFEVGEVAGSPYFALECVDGPSLDKRIAGQPQPARAAAQLVETLARAVQHAHDKGLVHRDLKPANILLTVDGTPKVGDFGLAKRLASPGGQPGETALTQSGMVLGTPSYMAPEQAWGRVKEVGPATDVYALGAILYELLTGRPPFLGATTLDTVLQVRHQEPVPPRRWLVQVPRDLETICLKCLQKEPAKRYGSASALAEDLKRFGNGEPIQARPIPAWEKALKWAQRKPAAAALIGVSGLALLTLFGVILGFTLQLQAALHEAQEQRQRAEERQQAAEVNERKALEEKQIANAVRSFLQEDLLQQADPAAQADALRRAGGGSQVKKNPTIGELLDRAAAELTPEKIEAKFPKQLGVQASILQTLGNTYRGIGQYDKAVELLNRSSIAYRDAVGPNDPATLDTLNSLGLAYQDAGKRAEAIAVHQQVRDIRMQQLGPNHRDTLQSLNNLALAYWADGRTPEAIALLEQVRDGRVQMLGADDPHTLHTFNNLALAYRAAGRIPDAIALYEQVRDIKVRKFGPDDLETLRTLNNLGVAYRVAGRTAEAIAVLERVRDALTKQLKADHPFTLATLNNLAQAYLSAGRTAEAIALFEQALDARRKHLPAGHPDTVNALRNLALAYLSADQPERALPLLQEAAARVEKRKFVHPLAGQVIEDLSNCQERLKQYEAAEAWRRKWLAAVQHQARPQPVAHAGALAALGRNLLLQQKYAEAEPMLRECLALRALHQPDAWTTFNAKSLFGEALVHQRKYAEAEPLLKDGYEGMKAREKTIPPEATARLTEALERLVALYDTWGKPEQAATWRQQLDQAKPSARPANR